MFVLLERSDMVDSQLLDVVVVLTVKCEKIDDGHNMLESINRCPVGFSELMCHDMGFDSYEELGIPKPLRSGPCPSPRPDAQSLSRRLNNWRVGSKVESTEHSARLLQQSTSSTRGKSRSRIGLVKNESWSSTLLA